MPVTLQEQEGEQNQQAAVLGRNKWRLIEFTSLQALLNEAQGNRTAALTLL